MEQGDRARVEAGVPSKRWCCGCWGGKDPENVDISLAALGYSLEIPCDRILLNIPSQIDA